MGNNAEIPIYKEPIAGSALGCSFARNLWLGLVFSRGSMKATVMAMMAAGALWVGGCASQPKVKPPMQSQTQGSPSQDGTVTGAGYNDRQIAKIQRGETTEVTLLEWFGAPDSRELIGNGEREPGARWQSGILLGERWLIGGTPDGGIRAKDRPRSARTNVEMG